MQPRHPEPPDELDQPAEGEPGAADSPDPSVSGRPVVRRPADDPVLPTQTTDDTDTDWRDRDDSGDDRYLRERPPHW